MVPNLTIIHSGPGNYFNNVLVYSLRDEVVPQTQKTAHSIVIMPIAPWKIAA